MRLKTALKRTMLKLAKRDSDAILSQISDASAVSFDVFDTLIKRETAEPTDVFRCMQLRLQQAGLAVAEGFARRRIEAERAARRAHPQTEVTLSEIYDRFPCDAGVRQELMKLEIQTEFDVCVPSLWIKRVYDRCVEQKKRIYFISDMYLPKEVVGELLKRCGYAEGTLYVSSESGLTKRSGQLFRDILAREKLVAREWVHIGDSIRSDFIAPKRWGIRSLLVDREPCRNPYMDRQVMRRNAGYPAMNHLIHVHLERYDDPYERIGYAVLGPLLYGFSTWLAKSIPKDEAIFFLAREGESLQRAFRIVSNRPSAYIYISRAAAHVAYMGRAQDVTEASQSRFHTIHRVHTQRELAMACGLSSDEVCQIFARHGLDEDTQVTGAEMEKSVLDAIWPSVRRKSAEQYALLERYLRQKGLSEKCAVIDVGWVGTIQMLLQAIGLSVGGKAVQWEGFYIGLDRSVTSYASSMIKRAGYLYGEQRDAFQYRVWNTVRSTVAFFEMMFLSVEGTTLAYRAEEDGVVRPVKKETDNRASANNRIVALQNAAMQFVCDLHRSPVKALVEMNSEVAIGNYLAFAGKQTLKSLELFKDFVFCDGTDEQSFLSRHGAVYYLLHGKQFRADFDKSNCKAWFIQSALKIPLPYISILGLLRRRTDQSQKT